MGRLVERSDEHVQTALLHAIASQVLGAEREQDLAEPRGHKLPPPMVHERIELIIQSHP